MLLEASFAVLLGVVSVWSAEPNPPTWPSSVKVFSPGKDSTTQQTIDDIFKTQGGHTPANNGQWSSNRYAFLFEPGTYKVNVNIGYYTTLMGMGKSPKSTVIQNVICENGDFDYTGGALDNFWRSAENFMTTPTLKWNNENSASMLWAVSQASPLRRVVINGDINLWQYNSGCCAGYASGGYLADSVVSGFVSSGSQQQWLSRNVEQGSWQGGVWNMVFLGVSGAPSTHCSNVAGTPYTTVKSTPVIAEKPYIYYSSGKYHLQIPAVETNKVGPTTNWGANDLSVDFSNVYVTKPTDSAATINAKLKAGIKYVVITPGIYNWSQPLNITQSNSVVLGLGMPTLISTAGNAVVQVAANLNGVRIAGLLLQAGSKESKALMTIGTAAAAQRGDFEYDATNPTILYDIFARVGGTNNPSQYQVSTISMVDIYSSNVIIDDAWFWRADHDISGLVKNSDNPVASGLRVYGKNVSAYGLAAEHTLGDLVQWSGDDGKVYFFQAEYPYDVTQANYGDKGYASFRVNASGFQGYGMGAYCYFRDNAVTVQDGFVTLDGAVLDAPFTVFLNGNGEIEHVWNDEGKAVSAAGETAYVCS